MKEIKSIEELDTMVKENSQVVLKLGTPYCGPCKMVEKNLEGLESEYPGVTFLKADVGDNEELADHFSLRSVPALVFYKDGEKKEQTGFLGKEDIIKRLENL